MSLNLKIFGVLENIFTMRGLLLTIAPACYDLAGMAGGLGPLGAVGRMAKRRGI